MSKAINVLIVGVGGQGTILASRVLGEVLTAAGYEVKISEVHGMSQRGGTVATQLRYGKKVLSPIIRPGKADIIMAFESLEALRYSKWLKAQGVMIVSDHRINPVPVITGMAKYPEDITQRLNQLDAEIIIADAFSLAGQAGNVKSINIVLLGILSNYLTITEEDWLAAIRKVIADRFVEVNLKAFSLGRVCGQGFDVDS